MRNVAAAMTLAAILTGCYASAVRDLNAKHIVSLKNRGAFDLNCTEAAIVITPLKHTSVGEMEQAGVSGCEKRATYILMERTGWVMNSEGFQAK